MIHLKKIAASLVLAGLLVLPVTSMAQNWYWVRSDDTNNYYIDTDSIKRTATGIQVLNRVEPLEGTETAYLIEYYPQTRQWKVLKQIIRYNTPGFMTYEPSAKHPAPLKQIEPGSLQEDVLRLLG
jgi:hypothetical protein